MRHITDDERRRRIARRHALAPAHRVTTPDDVTRAMTVLHSTEPPTPYLSVQARSDTATRADVDAALYEDRSLVKQLAMRRTLFVFPRDLLPAAWGGPGARTAGAEERRIAKEVVAAGIADDGMAWLEAAREEALAALAGGPMSTTELRVAVPRIAGKIMVSPGTKWGGEIPIGPRVLGWLGARGDIVRGPNTGHWRISRTTWLAMGDWLRSVPAPLTEDAAYLEIVRRWLTTFGPGTEADLVWWLGSTKTAVRRALSTLEAVPVSLDHDLSGWVLPGDEVESEDVEPWAALLPVLDPTTMGWRDRQFYLDPALTPYLFDTNGNAGTTAWWNGRIVGCWVQDEDGVVRLVTREPLPLEADEAFALEEARLTAWLDGDIVNTVYASLQMKSARLP